MQETGYWNIPIPMLPFLTFLESWINYDEAYEKLPKVVPYLILPLSAALLVLRFTQAAVAIWRGTTDRLVASHEIEEEDLEAAQRAANREV